MFIVACLATSPILSVHNHRILYTMWQQNLTADAKHRKCAKVVGDVMGNYHPHGDSALYETLVRMAQPFSLRYPLIDGSGNFGSLDGDAPRRCATPSAGWRASPTKCSRRSIRRRCRSGPTTTARKTEPVVLPSRIPNLLVNGATGIAVGMATNIPPHNLTEVCTALIKLLDNPDLSVVQLCRWVKGPDFPTGGQILNSADEMKEIYRTGSGGIRLRATWEAGPVGRARRRSTSPASRTRSTSRRSSSRSATSCIARKLPHLIDVKDLSTDDVRIDLELKRDADEKLVMAYLFKHTPLQTNFAVNLTCLVPTENAEAGRPERLDLKQMLWHFLHFRLDVVTSRLEHELEQLNKRIHILEGFEKVFDALDEIIAHHPQVRRQGRRRREDHQALRARRRADRRDPRAETVPAGPPRDPGHPERAQGEARAHAADRRAAQGRRRPLDAGARGARGDPEEVRRRRDARRSSRPTRPSTPPRPSSSTKTTSSSCRATAG